VRGREEGKWEKKRAAAWPDTMTYSATTWPCYWPHCVPPLCRGYTPLLQGLPCPSVTVFVCSYCVPPCLPLHVPFPVLLSIPSLASVSLFWEVAVTRLGVGRAGWPCRGRRPALQHMARQVAHPPVPPGGENAALASPHISISARYETALPRTLRYWTLARAASACLAKHTDAVSGPGWGGAGAS